ncbi:hypothetical protein CHGG_00239 [Chaetomium globosum CBS 148.51]|uniref:Uncharacterized protein n=1 Tax=Chaetomium globosum (strain ATCC 6205 / CBS 148.51 / DSM 1962 / NBRC 6347 / NRRL 1970) TaxID=306901 RepID=Q2HHR5_CHAGB|nr:uncharacterized protein CHGG_00239 [Chaetomium globosum CBS 148.51]EAQ92004.1 hypothetical protein CHGG_00239 [Chaetomium globosum CBS 148.51]
MATLAGKVVVVTGAASGIGRATAVLLAERSALLSLSDVNEAALATVKSELEKSTNAKVFTSAFDVRNQEATHAWIRDTVAHYGQPIYGAANVAGVVGPSLAMEKGTIRNITDQEFDWVSDINMKGVLNCLRAELPHMQEGKDGRNGGSIVNVASLAGLLGVPYDVPGIIDTPQVVGIEEKLGEASATLFGGVAPGPLARRGDASEVAEAIVFLLSPQSSFINGVALPIEGGWSCSV